MSATTFVRSVDPAGEAPSRVPTPRAVWWCVGALTGLNFALTLIDLTSRSLWLDEVSTSWTIAGQHFPKFLSIDMIEIGSGNMMAYYGALHFVIALFGDSTFWLRFPSVITGAATIPVLFLLGRRCGGNRVGLLAAMLGSVSLPLIFWSQNARGYSAGAFLTALMALTFLRAIESTRTRDFVVWGIVSVVACYTLILAVGVVVALVVSLFFRPNGTTPWRRVAISVAVIAAADVPLAYVASRPDAQALAWIPPPNVGSLEAAVGFLASNGVFSATTWTDKLMALLWVLLWGGIAGSTLWVIWRQGRSLASATTAAIACWLAIPLAIILLLSPVQHLLISRYLIISLPAGLLLAAIALDRLRAPFALGLLALLVAVELAGLPSQDGRSLGDYRDAFTYVFSHEQAGDCISFSPNDLPAYGYYLERDAPKRSIDAAPRHVIPKAATTVNPVSLYQEIQASYEQWLVSTSSFTRAQTSGCPRVWYLSANGNVGDNSGSVDGRYVGQISSEYATRTVDRFSGYTLYLFDDRRGASTGSRS